jgi:long-chain acyl-CoA synthetase
MKKPRGPALAADYVVRLLALVACGLAWPFERLGHLVVFRKVKRLTGARLRGAISGGGLMPAHIDRFFRRIGVPILVGYGLTETSPVVSVRREERNVLGTIGTLVPEVEVEIRHPETGARLSVGEVGLIFTRGPHVMQGYYLDEELTRRAIDPKGWFDTGDLGCLTEEGDLCFRGRHKETIVLRGGENVEPGRVEQALLSSPLIAQAIVVGQDQKVLAALLVADPQALARRLGVPEGTGLPALSARPDAHDVLKAEAIARTTGLKSFERVARVALLGEALDAENGCLTQTLKPRRHVIVERFAAKIEEAFR